jgi:hypothetical protein
MNIEKKYLVVGIVSMKSIFPTSNERDKFDDWLIFNTKNRKYDSGTYEKIILASTEEEAYTKFLQKLPKYVTTMREACKIEEIK